MNNTQKPPAVILHASRQPYLSIGVRYGGMTYQNKTYKYLPEHDAFILEKYLRKYRAHKKEGKTWSEFIGIIRTEA